MGVPNFRQILSQIAAQQQQHQQRYLASAGQQPIPGLTGSVMPGAGGIPRAVPMAPPQQLQAPPPQRFPTFGPYGQQAAQMAGLLSQPMTQAPMQPPMQAPPAQMQGGINQTGLLGGGGKGFRIPFNRPIGK